MARIVLVADDSPTIQKRAVGILKGEGFEVETVSNGVAAIKRLAVLRPVAILADVSMPGRDGYEVCDFVKNSPELCHVPVLLVASDMEPYNSAKGTEVRADGIIKKPFEARELISNVVKFAELFESTAMSIPETPVAPSAAPEPKEEFAATGDAADITPTIAQPVEPDFSAQAGGVAFAEPVAEEAPAFSLDPQMDGSETPFAAPQADAARFPESDFALPNPHAEEPPLAAETPWDPHSFAPPPPHEFSTDVAAFAEGVEAPAPAPLFIDEQAAPSPVPTDGLAALRTAIFRTPLNIAENAWKDEAVPAAPEAESAGPAALEPQFITEEIESSSESPHEHPHGHPHEHMHFSNSVRSTNLDSFSLDDAAAGQVRFASELPEVVYAAHTEETAAAEPAPPEPAREVATSEATVPEATPEVVYADAAVPEPVPEVVYAEAGAVEPTTEAVQTEVASAEPAAEPIATEAAVLEDQSEAIPAEVARTGTSPEVSHAEVDAHKPSPESVQTDIAPAEPVAEAVQPETDSDKPSVEAIQTEAAPVEPTPETAHSEFHLPEATPEVVLSGIATVGAAVEAMHEGIAHHEAVPDVIHHEAAPAEPVPEAVHIQEPVDEPILPTEQPKPVSEVAAPPPATNREQVLCIVEKVVLKMAHPMLTAEAVQEIAKRLTEEIVAEIGIESFRHKA